jgi:hypothetical protein
MIEAHKAHHLILPALQNPYMPRKWYHDGLVVREVAAYDELVAMKSDIHVVITREPRGSGVKLPIHVVFNLIPRLSPCVIDTP